MTTIDPQTLQITPDGVKHLMTEIDMLQDEIKLLKRQLEHEKDLRNEANYKLRALLFELEVLK